MLMLLFLTGRKRIKKLSMTESVHCLLSLESLEFLAVGLKVRKLIANRTTNTLSQTDNGN